MTIYQNFANGSYIMFNSDGTNQTFSKTLPHFNSSILPDWFLGTVIFGIIFLAVGVYLIKSRP